MAINKKDKAVNGKVNLRLLNTCEYCGARVKNYWNHIECCPVRTKIQSKSRKNSRFKCQYCGYVVLTEYKSNHMDETCIVNCACGSAIKGVLIDKHRKRCDSYKRFKARQYWNLQDYIYGDLVPTAPMEVSSTARKEGRHWATKKIKRK